MIIGFFIAIFVSTIIALFSAVLLTGTTLPTAIPDAIYHLAHYAGMVNLFLPVSELVICMVFIGSLMVTIFSVRLIFYVIALIRGNSTPGSN